MNLILLYLTTLLICYIFPTTKQQSKNDSSLVLYLSEYGLKSIQKSILPEIFNNYPIPLPSPGVFEKNIDFIGNLKLNITNLSLKFDKIGDDQIDLIFIENNNTINLTLKDITGSLNFTYDFQSGFYNNKATGVIVISGMGVEISTIISTINNSKYPDKLNPNFQINLLKVPISPLLKINFDAPGRVEMLVKFFFDLISNSISESIVNNLSIEKVDNLNKNISNFMANLELRNTYQNITVDYSLNYDPIIKNKTLEFPFDTVLFAGDNLNNYTYKGKKYDLPHNFYGNAPLFGLFNQYLLDGFFDISQELGKLKAFIFAETIQTDLFKLDVNGVSKFLPNITKNYNSTDKVDLNISSSATPILNFKNQKINAEFNFVIDFLVRKSNNFTNEINHNQNESAALIEFKLNADLGFNIQNAILQIKIKSVEFTDAKVLRSLIGKIEIEKFKSDLNLNINIILLIYSNFNYDLGIFLPRLPGISLNQTTVIPHEGYLEFGIIPQPNKKLKLKFLEDQGLEIKNNKKINLEDIFEQIKDEYLNNFKN